MNSDTTESDPFAELLASLIDDSALPSATRKSYSKNSVIYYEGQEDRSILLVESGCLRLESYSPEGKVCVHALCSVGSVFGELGLIAARRSESAIAMKDSVVTRVASREFLLVAEREGYSGAIVGFLASRVERQQRLINSFVTMDCRRRLAVILLELGHAVGRPTEGGLRIDERLSHEVLGSMVGTTRSRIGLFLQEFRQLGMISIGAKSGMLIHPDALGAEAGFIPI